MKKVLIIDDEPLITEVLDFFAQKIGYESDAAHSGNSALERIDSNRYFAVFCDLQMPGLNGMEIYERLKELNEGLSEKFILLTGSVLDQHMEAKVAKQSIRVLQKPFHFENIKEVFTQLEL